MLSLKVNVKPLSVNRVWQGRRFKTKEYKQYEQHLLSILPDADVPDGPLKITFVFGLSSLLSDWDNPVKPLQDVLQKRYNFNDSRVMLALVTKVKVDKGEEFSYVRIERVTDDELLGVSWMLPVGARSERDTCISC